MGFAKQPDGTWHSDVIFESGVNVSRLRVETLRRSSTGQLLPTITKRMMNEAPRTTR